LGLFIPIRFIFTNKLHKDAKLLLAFDAFVLSNMAGAARSAWARLSTETTAPTVRVNTGAMLSEVRKLTEKVGVLLSSNSPPELISQPTLSRVRVSKPMPTEGG